MSYQERRTLANLVGTILVNVLYTAYMMQRYPTAGDYSPEIFHYWATFFLILIPISILAYIIIYIVFSILNAITTREVEPDITDERDRLIELKGNQIAAYVFGIGFILAMIALVASLPPAAMFAILLCAGLASEMLSSLLQFYFYRRGV